MGALIEVNEAVVAIARQMGFRNQRYEYHIIFVRLWKEISPWYAGSQNQQDHHEIMMSGPRAAPHFPDKLIPREFAPQQLNIGKKLPNFPVLRGLGFGKKVNYWQGASPQ